MAAVDLSEQGDEEIVTAREVLVDGLASDPDLTGDGLHRQLRQREALQPILAEPQPDTAIYCCGPEPLLQAVETRCHSWPPGALRVERFAPADGAHEGPNGEFEVEFRRSGVTLTVPADRTILEVGLDAGLELFSSCTEGTCSTCETDILDGVPDHRDSVLTDDEKRHGDTMMICVSRACSNRLVLDA